MRGGREGPDHGDPAKLAQALLVIAGQDPPPPRFAGADAIVLAEQKVAGLQDAINADRDLSTSLALDGTDAAGNRS